MLSVLVVGLVCGCCLLGWCCWFGVLFGELFVVYSVGLWFGFIGLISVDSGCC